MRTDRDIEPLAASQKGDKAISHKISRRASDALPAG